MLKSLARAVARGRSPASWAKQHDSNLETVQEWRALPEFDGLVDAHRLRVVDLMSGTLMTGAQAAIDLIISASRHNATPADTAKLSAARKLLDNWLRVSLRFEQSRKMAELKARIIAVEQKAKNQAPNGYWPPHLSGPHGGSVPPGG